MTTLLLHLSDVDEAAWAKRYAETLPEVTVVRQTESFDPKAIDYIFDVPDEPPPLLDDDDGRPFSACRRGEVALTRVTIRWKFDSLSHRRGFYPAPRMPK